MAQLLCPPVASQDEPAAPPVPDDMILRRYIEVSHPGDEFAPARDLIMQAYSMRELIVLEPQWVLDAMSCVVRDL